MKVKEMLILARQRLGDMQKTSYSDIELIYCLNSAIDRLSYELYNQNDPELTKKMTLNGTQETKRPDDFIAFRGQFPVEFEYRADGPIMKHLDPEFDGEIEIVYYVAMPHVKSLEDEIPFKRVMFNKQLLQFLLYEAKPSIEQAGQNSNTTPADQG